ncbi:MAG TPA: hypothetical protein VH143_00675 [Kofleriaceae bacterium]|jgi:hypothetical protein|nr:hypothetical protein [Kofleriaceae bacterium]
MATRSWYRVALAVPSGGPQLVLASGEHAGQAISEAEHAISASVAIAIDPATTDEIPLGESVGKGHIVRLPVDVAPALSQFRFPRGVLPAISGQGALAGVEAGWVEHASDGLYVVEIQVDAEHLVDTFLGLLERLPAADNLEVRVLDHFEQAGTTDVWLTSRTHAKKILRFLDDHDAELIDNGHVELSIYLRAQKATLRLTEHKTVVWLADDRAMAGDVERWLRELAVPKQRAHVTIDSVPHVHYRTVKSLGRKKLGDELYRQRLRRVDTLKPAVG